MLRSKIFLLGMVAASFTSFAYATSAQCSDASGDFRYNLWSPDGGPQREKDISWTIRGKQLIEVSSMEIVAPGGNGFSRRQRQVTSEFRQVQVFTDIASEDNVVSDTAEYAQVYSFPANELIFTGLVLCHRITYVGRPRP